MYLKAPRGRPTERGLGGLTEIYCRTKSLGRPVAPILRRDLHILSHSHLSNSLQNRHKYSQTETHLWIKTEIYYRKKFQGNPDPPTSKLTNVLCCPVAVLKIPPCHRTFIIHDCIILRQAAQRLKLSPTERASKRPE